MFTCKTCHYLRDVRTHDNLVSHSFVKDIMFHIRYQTILSSTLPTFMVISLALSTNPLGLLQFSHRVFQGDTMYLIIFLIALTPVRKRKERLLCPGFLFSIPIPKCHDFPHLSSSILLQAAKVSIICSQQIFMAHKMMVWCDTRSLIT